MIKKITKLIFTVFGLTAQLNAQCISSGPKSPSNVSNNTSIGTVALTNTGNIFNSDDVRSTASAFILGDKTNYLVATGFDFSIPESVIICGISVEMEKSATGLFQNVKDNSVKIVKGGIILGTEHSLGASWSSSDDYSSYSGSNDLWGTTWTSADINAGNFGVAISANLSGVTVLPTARVDHIKITVHYSNSVLPIELLSLDATCINKKTTISWTVASQNNNDFFTIEKTNNGINYEIIGTVNGTRNSNQIINYSFIDTEPLTDLSYYRLKQTDINGEYKYYNLPAVNCNSLQIFVIYSNPETDQIIVEFNYSKNENYKLTLYDIYGRLVQTISNITSGKIEIERQNLASGLYILQLWTDAQIIATGKLILK